MEAMLIMTEVLLEHHIKRMKLSIPIQIFGSYGNLRKAKTETVKMKWIYTVNEDLVTAFVRDGHFRYS